jgi:hypothetical protein
MCAFPALVALLMGNASSAAGASVLQVKAHDAKTVIVHGKGFPDEKLLVSADMDMPHASVACYTDLTRVALVKGGEFEIATDAFGAGQLNSIKLLDSTHTYAIHI